MAFAGYSHSMSADVQLDNVWVQFGDFIAVRDASLTIEGGEFFSFLGPSGCGKTTLLRAISVFQTPSRGRVLIGGEDMGRIGPNHRLHGVDLSESRIVPLMRVWENISFALEGRSTKRRAVKRPMNSWSWWPCQVKETKWSMNCRAAEAKGRCSPGLVCRTEVLLLDEPLSALDLKLRQHMRTELRAIQQRAGITFIYITHDQGEA